MTTPVRVCFIPLIAFYVGCNGSDRPSAQTSGSQAAPSATAGCTAQTPFQIVEPTKGEVVGNVPTVQGTFATPKSQILVVVHPLAIGADHDFWVQQPLAVVGKDCSWNVAVHIGEPSTHNESFEIQAFENAQLQPGDTQLHAWPAAESHSNLVKVLRE